MNNLGNLCFISLAVCLMSTVLVQTEVSQPSKDDPLKSLDTNADNFTDVAVGEVEHEHFEDGNHKNLTINTEGEEKGGEKCSNYEIASKDDIFSLNETLGDILGKEMDEFKFMKDRMNRLEESMTTLTKCTSKAPLRFHSSFYGNKVEFSKDYRSATRTTPREDEGGHATVVSQRTLCDGEIFNFRIDETIDKWAIYGVAFGVIIDPSQIYTSRDIFYNDKIHGTWSICSWPYSPSGRSDPIKDGLIRIQDGYFLPTNNLSVGSVLGVSRRENGDLHFYLNDIDKGIAFREVPKEVYAFVDVINYVTKISVLD